jgi:hypothetical protein
MCVTYDNEKLKNYVHIRAVRALKYALLHDLALLLLIVRMNGVYPELASGCLEHCHCAAHKLASCLVHVLLLLYISSTRVTCSSNLTFAPFACGGFVAALRGCEAV